MKQLGVVRWGKKEGPEEYTPRPGPGPSWDHPISEPSLTERWLSVKRAKKVENRSAIRCGQLWLSSSCGGGIRTHMLHLSDGRPAIRRPRISTIHTMNRVKKFQLRHENYD